MIKRIHLEDYIVPFTRCLRCNGLLEEVGKMRMQNIVPVQIYCSMDTFYQCRVCLQVYWKGSHWNRLMDIIKKIFINIRIEF